MSYFQRHSHKGGHHEPQNLKPTLPSRIKKSHFHSKTQASEPVHPKPPTFNQVHLLGSNKARSPLKPKPQQNIMKPIPQRDIPGLMLQGQNSMEQLLNSSINQFTKYLSNRDPLEQQHQQLVAQNKDLRKTLEKLKIIIKQKLVSALSKQRQELNAVMQDYVQLITKLLADKQELTSTLQKLESSLSESQQQCQQLARSQGEIHSRVEELTREREQHIAKTKLQIDDFLQIIEQYQQQAQQQGKEGQQLRNKISQLEQQLSKTQKASFKQILPQKTQDLLELLEKAQQENKMLRRHLSEEKLLLQRQHEQEFIEYERAMKETLTNKDECIAHLKNIIENLRGQRGKDSTMGTASDIDLSHE